MADRDLDALRSYRVADTALTPGLLERLEEDLLQAILDGETAGSAARSTVPLRPQVPQRGRFARWLGSGSLVRPAMAGAAALVLATGVAVLSDGGADGSDARTANSGTVTQASTNLFDATATALFGRGSSTPAAVGTTPLDQGGESSDLAAVLAAGPGTSSDDATTRAAQLPGSSTKLRSLLRRAADASLADVTGQQVQDTGDRVAFYLGMRWVIDPDVPGATRAAILRSLAGLDDIDRAVRGPDLLGRTGIVLSHYDETSGLREQYVLDPNGGELLERRTFTTAYVDPACPPGTYTDYALYVHGTPVSQAQTPFLEWPSTVVSCDPSGIRLA